MTQQASAISETLSQTSSLLSGLLAQIGGNGAQGDIFSSLLSQDGAQDSDAATVAAASSVPAPSASAGSAPTPLAGLMETLNDLSSTLQKTLSALRQQNNATSANAATNSQSATQTPPQAPTQNSTSDDPASGFSNSIQLTGWKNKSQSNGASSSPSASGFSTVTPPSDGSAADSSSTNSSSSSADAQTLADIITQLLALTQTMMKDLQQKQTAAGAVGGGQNAVVSSASQTTEAAAAPVDSTGALFGLLADLQKITRQLSSAKANAAPASPLASAAVPDSGAASLAVDPSSFPSSTSTDLTAQLASLEAQVKNILAAHQQNKEQNTVNFAANAAQTASPAAVDVAPATTIAAASTPATLASAGKQDVSGVWQTQIAAVQENSIGPTGLAPTAAQVFVNSAAPTAAANSAGTDADTESDMLSGGKASGPQILTGNDATATVGGQATGTYSFASTLSALRATNGGSIGLPSVIDQVVLQMNRGVKNGNDQMSVQLNPADLGKITVKLDFGADGKVQGTVTADNPQTLGMLQKDSRSLERALQDAGLRADPGSLQFNLGGQGQSNSGNNANQTANNGNGNADATAANGTLSAGDAIGIADGGAAAETYYLTPGGVNIQV